ncbi:helix-turn-helix domain-containing protein [Rhodoplanes sp. TEM]|uniref:Helix-turn-helix domain-containing protein n=1 Tax=Rhodoplanes tepidamans TaxID=200616 RepID=A0ABT5JE96_RHOTP|nr:MULTISPECIES: helix-turn-helix domain-containing protein [Rhodoplanes]MDC7788004.1 helix-turn-helix domain-containing protein [Rhodoplanes tepidamans]MDC7984844.1 helix-turn-helix domain-containing protein [Rhodoplanes sp. TEM]MDQ0358433.1 chromosomal replication initiator protein [Rhodoplanes tepidamans]
MSDGTVSIRMILRAVGLAWGIPGHVIRSARRTADVAAPRHAVCLLAREMTQLSFPAIGRLLGNRDHSTIIQAAQRAEELAATDAGFAHRLSVARQTVLTSLGTAEQWQDADAVQIAERVMAADPWRAATDLAVDEVVAVAARAVALEEVAATSYRLLALLDEHDRLRRGGFADAAAIRRANDIAVQARAFADALADALQGLGYEYAEPAELPQPQETADASPRP